MLVEFKSSGNYTVALKSDAVQNVSVPQSCLPEGDSCSDLAESDADDSDGDTLEISVSGDNCLLEVEFHKADSTAGVWEVDGSQLTMTDSDGPDTSAFCVSGNTLTVKSVDDLYGTVSWGVFERL
jgi:hypothetical protein